MPTDPATLVPALPTVESSETLPARLQAILEQAIINGRLEPESRLSADDLAAHFGVSRIPVREALRSLHEAGWVEIRPRHGVHVRRRDAAELDDLFEFRSHVERGVAALAAVRRDDEDVARLDAIMASSREARARADLETLDANGLALYAALRAAARNRVMAATSVVLEQRARFYYITIADALGLDWVDVHERIATLVQQGDGDGAAQAIGEHILDTGARTRALLFG